MILLLAAQGRSLLPDAVSAEHRVRVGGRGRAPAARLHRGGDQLPRLRLHADQPAGRPARTLHRAHVQVRDLQQATAEDR